MSPVSSRRITRSSPRRPRASAWRRRAARERRRPGGNWRTGRAPCAAAAARGRRGPPAAAGRFHRCRRRRTGWRRTCAASASVLGGSGSPCRVVGGVADRRLRHLELRAVVGGERAQRLHRLGGDFRADAVAGRMAIFIRVFSRPVAAFEGGDLVLVGQRSGRIVEALQQAMLGEGIDLEGMHGAVGRGHRLHGQVDRDARARRSLQLQR